MNERSQKISKLKTDQGYRNTYIKAKLNVLIPSQIRALRLKSGKKQSELAKAAEMKQSRISAMETPGGVNFNLETLVRLASVFKVGLVVKFVSYSNMLEWESSYSQDNFKVEVVDLDNDRQFMDGKSSYSRDELEEVCKDLFKNYKADTTCKDIPISNTYLPDKEDVINNVMGSTYHIDNYPCSLDSERVL